MLNSDFVVTNQEIDLGVATTSPEAAQRAGQLKEARKLLGITKNGTKNMTPCAFLLTVRIGAPTFRVLSTVLVFATQGQSGVTKGTEKGDLNDQGEGQTALTWRD